MLGLNQHQLVEAIPLFCAVSLFVGIILGDLFPRK